MRTTTLFLAAGALIIAPTAILAHPGGGSRPGQGASMGAMSQGSTGATPSGHRDPSPTTAPGNGQCNGTGYNHSTSGQAKGHQGQSCETLGTTPGHSATAPGGGSPFSGEDSKGGSHYAGSQKQNSRNSASESQYDVACAN